jgi:hypothetical protein
LSTPPLGTPNAASPKSTEPCTSRQIFFYSSKQTTSTTPMLRHGVLPQVPHLYFLSMSRPLLVS